MRFERTGMSAAFFFMGSFPTVVQQEFLYQEEPLVGASVGIGNDPDPPQHADRSVQRPHPVLNWCQVYRNQ